MAVGTPFLSTDVGAATELAVIPRNRFCRSSPTAGARRSKHGAQPTSASFVKRRPGERAPTPGMPQQRRLRACSTTWHGAPELARLPTRGDESTELPLRQRGRRQARQRALARKGSIEPDPPLSSGERRTERHLDARGILHVVIEHVRALTSEERGRHDRKTAVGVLHDLQAAVRELRMEPADDASVRG